MIETVVLVSLIVGFVLVTVLSLAGMLLTRHRDQKSGDRKEIAECVAKIDEATNAALTELNKTAAIVSEEINEKYQSMLFLYNLLEDKKKELIIVSESLQPQPMVQSAATVVNSITHKPNGTQKTKEPEPGKIRTVSKINPKRDEVMQLSEVGYKPVEIAKELNMGQGEVRLILDLAKMS